MSGVRASRFSESAGTSPFQGEALFDDPFSRFAGRASFRGYTGWGMHIYRLTEIILQGEKYGLTGYTGR